MNRVEPIDWQLVERVALHAVGGRGRLENDEVEELERSYSKRLQRYSQVVGQACGGGTWVIPQVRVVDRQGWVKANLCIARDNFGGRGISRKITQGNALVGDFTAIYLGKAMGNMGNRVLGQYDPVYLLNESVGVGAQREPSMLIVAPNIERRKAEQHVAVGDGLVEMVFYHEMAHAYIFTHHEWLRKYLGSCISQTKKPDWNRDWTEDLVDSLVRARKIQAAMSAIEGHGNFMMRRAGRLVIPNFDEVDRVFRERHDAGLWGKLNEIVSGISLKMAQYERGEKFLQFLEREGVGANQVFAKQESLPTLAELKRPERWVLRNHDARGI